MGCENCEHAPTTYEEYCMSFAHPNQYCPDAYLPNAIHCNNYNSGSEGIIMTEKKYKVAWKREIIARDMRLDDALLFIKTLCDKYYEEEVEIELLESSVPEETV